MPKDIPQEFPTPENGFAPARREADRDDERDRDRDETAIPPTPRKGRPVG